MNVMYIISVVLFFFPSALLWAAWRRRLRDWQQSPQSNWRIYCVNAALIFASCATLAVMGFVISWFHNGGSPHGLAPAPGLWKSLGPIFTWTLTASLILAILGNGKARFYVLGWAGAAVVALALVFMLEMD
jgi:Mn2+/Fe2+ NRAMP family transporter